MEFTAISDRLKACTPTMETLTHVIALRDIEIYLLKQEKAVGTVKSFDKSLFDSNIYDEGTFSDIEEEPPESAVVEFQREVDELDFS
jgi:hypothetical protein